MTQAVILCSVYLQETLHLLSILYSHEELKSMCVIQITHLSFFSILKLLTHSQIKWSLLGRLLYNHVWAESVAGAELTARPWLAPFPRHSAGLLWWPVAGPWTRRRGLSFSSWSSASQSFMPPWEPTSDYPPRPQLGRKCLLQMLCL